MRGFAGGSAWAMARDVGEGHVLVTQRSIAQMTATQLDRLTFELERRLRELRGEPRDLEDIQSLNNRNRRMQRLSQAVGVIRAFRRQRRL